MKCAIYDDAGNAYPIPNGNGDTYEALASEIGRLTDEKGRQYGNASVKVEAMMKVLYPDGVPVHALRNALLIVRMLDKFCRIANQGPDGLDKGGEEPWKDCGGYSLMGLKQAREAK